MWRCEEGVCPCFDGREGSDSHTRAPGTDVPRARNCVLHRYGWISHPNIMAWSSWARLWQWATYLPVKVRKFR